MGSFCGTNPQTVVTNPTNPNVTAQQNQIYGLVNQYATDFGQNPSQLIAPWNQMQINAAQGVSDYATANQPYINTGAGMIGEGSTAASFAPSFYGTAANTLSGVNPIAQTPWNPTPYESPYTQDVINATMANIQQQNQVQQQGALSNAINAGTAFGGDRGGLMMDYLANQQALAGNQTMAALQQADFNQASQQANAQQQYNLNLGLSNNAQMMQQAGAYGTLGGGLTQYGLGQGNLGYQYGNLGNLGQSGTLNAMQGLYNMGTGLQNTQQQQLSAPLTFGSWYGSSSPGTQTVSTSTTYPGANPLSTITGLGLTGAAAASLLSNTGLFSGAAAALPALFHEGGRIGKDLGGSAGSPNTFSRASEDDLVGRYHHIKSTLERLHRDAGGPTMQQPQPGMGQLHPAAAGVMQMVGNVPSARQMPTSQGYQFRHNIDLMRGVSDTADPATSQAAFQQLSTQQQGAADGGAIHKDLGGSSGAVAPAPEIPGSFADLGPSGGTGDPMDPYHKGVNNVLGLARLAMKFLDRTAPQQHQVGAPQASGSGSPTQAPNSGGSDPMGIGSLAKSPLDALKFAQGQKKQADQLAQANSQPGMPGAPIPTTPTIDSSGTEVMAGGGGVHGRGSGRVDGPGAYSDDAASPDARGDATPAETVPEGPDTWRTGQVDPEVYAPGQSVDPQGGATDPSMHNITPRHGPDPDMEFVDRPPPAPPPGGGTPGVDEMIKQLIASQAQYRRMMGPMALAALGSSLIPQRTAQGIFQPIGARAGEAMNAVLQAGQGRDLETTAQIVGALQRRQAFAEEQWKNRQPTWNPTAGGKDFYGNPIGAWVQPGKAPPEVQMGVPDPLTGVVPGGGGAAPAAPPASPSEPGAPGASRSAPGIYVPPSAMHSEEAGLEYLQGEQFREALKAKNPGAAAVVQGIVNGVIAPSDPRVRGMQGQKYLQWAIQWDPSFNALNWPARLAATKALAPGGKIAMQNASVGMLIGHLAKQYELAEKLGNWDYVPTFLREGISNPFARTFETGPGGGASALNDYEAQAHKTAAEMTKVLVGPGGGTEEDRAKNYAPFSSEKSGSTLKSAIRTAIDQMEQRQLESVNQVNQAFGTNYTTRDPRFMAPEHRAALEELERKLGGHGTKGGSVPGGPGGHMPPIIINRKTGQEGVLKDGKYYDRKTGKEIPMGAAGG